jgi:SOS-response transcriptional repressor LexA
VNYYQSRGGLSAYTLDYRNRALSVDAVKLKNQLTSKVKNAIKVGPVQYAGGGSTPVFAYDKADKTVLVGSDIWKELSLMGPWIQDATILRWAELTSKISKGEIKPSTVIDCLLTCPITERDVGAARRFYDGLTNKVCVWSDKRILSTFDLDHAIPFSLWKNNDLWNLLPADSKINGQKKDRLPTRELIRRRRDCVVDYWSQINKVFPARFEYEAEKFMGGRFDSSNWETRLFSTFAEAVEVTAVQRGVDRWDIPSSHAVAASVVCELAETKSNIIEFPSAEKRFKTCIPFYALAATAGVFNLDQYAEDDDLSEHAEWIAVDDIRVTPDLFALRIVGHSMEPRISDGDICIFRRGSALAGSRNGRIMLVKHHGIRDADTNGQFTIKRYESERIYDEDGVPQHVKITLQPFNPDYDPIIIEKIEEEGEFRVLGEFVGKVNE